METEKLTLASKEKELILKVLSKTRWDLDKASKLLRIKPNMLKRKIKIHNIEPSS
jgi:transcriptional regulator of acetoin/glycerol metabolism